MAADKGAVGLLVSTYNMLSVTALTRYLTILFWSIWPLYILACTQSLDSVFHTLIISAVCGSTIYKNRTSVFYRIQTVVSV